DREELSLEEWTYNGGIVDPGQKIAYNLYSDKKLVFFITPENPKNWSIFHKPLEHYNYSTGTSIRGNFNSSSSEILYYVIYNDPNFNNSTISVRYDIQYGDVVDFSFISFLILCTGLSAVLVGNFIYEYKYKEDLVA
ncbi:MAG: hypothetical protein ACFFDT_19270, partial [Candidatus Hodarchaeota archaeon]